MPTIFQMSNGCGFKNRIFFITAIGLSRLGNDLAALDVRSSPDSACRWRIDLDYGLLMRRMARQRQSRLNQAAIVLVS
jgi:hypothetical protein